MATPLLADRFEFKYVVREQQARAIREFIRPYLVADDAAAPGESYRVSSLYLDAPAMTLYRQTIHALKNRFKLRIRFYDDDPSPPAFLEIKRRVNLSIKKQRAPLTRAGCVKLIDGEAASDHWLLSRKVKALQALHDFRDLMHKLDARPSVYVSYLREAYVAPEGNYARVTFDRDIGGAPAGSLPAIACPKDLTPSDVGGVVLELKFSERLPLWMRDLIFAFNLQRCSVPKYVVCADAIQKMPSRADSTSHFARRA